MGLFDHLTRRALNLVDPYKAADTPPADQVWAYLKACIPAVRWLLVLSLSITILTASIEVWLIGYVGRLIDTVAATAPERIWIEHGRALLGAAFFVLLIRPLSQFARYAINDIGLQCNIANMVRWQAHSHVTQQSVGWFQGDLAGRIATRLIDIGNYASDTIYNALNAVAFGLVYVIGIILLMAQTDIRLAFPLLFWIALYFAVMSVIIPRMVRAQRIFQSSKSALVGGVVDGLSNMDTLKLFAGQDSIAHDHKIDLETTRQALFRTRKIGVGMRTIVSVLEGAIMVGFVGFSLMLWSTGAASIGLIGAAMALTLRITAMADWILDAVWIIFLRVGSLREALRTVGQPITIPNPDDSPRLSVRGGEICIRDVHHHYGLGQGGLNGVSLTIKPGEKVALVGRSGAGKSTLVNLILRFFETERGEILIDGQDIRRVEQDSLRSCIGMVSQQASLLHRSVRDNIALGQKFVTDDQIIAAATEAHAHDFIMELTDGDGRCGYDAQVGERGVKLSGGQRQRVALARVILKNAPILILDEATSALDSEVESQIQTALQGIMREKTVIAVAHRLSTIAQMDRIVVMENGNIIEQGSHQELLDRHSVYAKFWDLQSGGFIRTDGVTQ